VIADIVAAQARAQPFAYPSGLIEVPMSPVSDIAAFRNGRWSLDAFVATTRCCVEQVIADGGAFDFLGHPACLNVVDPGFRTLDAIRAAGDRAELTDLGTIAAGVGRDCPVAGAPVTRASGVRRDAGRCHWRRGARRGSPARRSGRRRGPRPWSRGGRWPGGGR